MYGNTNTPAATENNLALERSGAWYPEVAKLKNKQQVSKWWQIESLLIFQF